MQDLCSNCENQIGFPGCNKTCFYDVVDEDGDVRGCACSIRGIKQGFYKPKGIKDLCRTYLAGANVECQKLRNENARLEKKIGDQSGMIESARSSIATLEQAIKLVKNAID